MGGRELRAWNSTQFPHDADAVGLWTTFWVASYWETMEYPGKFSSVQSFSRVRLCDPMECSTPGLHPSPTPGVYSNSYPLSWWCHPTISSSVDPFSSHPQSFPAFSNESVLRIRWPCIGVSASASVLPMNIQGWFPLGLTGLISLLSKGHSRIFSERYICANHL